MSKTRTTHNSATIDSALYKRNNALYPLLFSIDFVLFGAFGLFCFVHIHSQVRCRRALILWRALCSQLSSVPFFSSTNAFTSRVAVFITSCLVLFREEQQILFHEEQKLKTQLHCLFLQITFLSSLICPSYENFDCQSFHIERVE
jgi:hypothetical protein